MGLSLKVHF